MHSLTSRLLQPTIAATSAWLCPPRTSITSTSFLDIRMPLSARGPLWSLHGEGSHGTARVGFAVPRLSDWRYRQELLLSTLNALQDGGPLDELVVREPAAVIGEKRCEEPLEARWTQSQA